MSVQNIVVAGKSGAGKQPRIDVLVERYGLRQLSTGNIFREYLGAWKKVRDQVDLAALDRDDLTDDALRALVSPAAAATGVDPDAAVLGAKAARYVDRGRFVPDDITNALFEAAFRASDGQGLVLDGYPRTPEQAAFLLEAAARAGTRLDLVLVVDNDDEAIVARTTGRRICPACGKVYHLQYKPPREGRYCTACGTEVILRSDDTEERIRTRLEEYRTKALPAIRHLEAAGVALAHVPGNLPVFTDEAVRESVLSVVEPALAR